MWGLRGLRRLRVSESWEPNPRLWGLCLAETSRKRREGSRMFDALIESSHSPEKRRSRTVFVSLLIHSVVLAVIVVIPLIYYQGLPEYELLTVLAAPPNSLPPPGPPSPPAPPPPERGEVQIVRLDPDRFAEPAEIPEEIPAPDEDIPIISTSNWGPATGVPGGVQSGIQGGVPNGTVGRVLGGFVGVAPPPPPPPEPREPIRVSIGVQNSRLIHQVNPVYPTLAKRARVSGIVLLQVTVDERGVVAAIKLIRGHPLLNQSAIDAVSQWKYSPTLLSGEPVPVIATVTVNFVLR